eukprot:g638.t1
MSTVASCGWLFFPDTKVDGVKRLPLNSREGIHGNRIVVQLLLIGFAATQWRGYNISRRALKWAWGLMYITPFVLMMVYPYRLAVDWDAASVSVCKATLQDMAKNDALSLFQLSRDSVLRSKITQELLKPSPSPDVYCEQHGTQWTVALVDDIGMLKCDFQTPPDATCCQLRELSDAQCLAQQDLVSDDSDLTLYSYLTNLEAVATTTVTALDNSKFVLGMLMGVYAVKLLLPAVFGLINGLSSALLHMKVQLPKIIVIAYILLLSTVMIVPVLAAFLAAVFQVVGTYVLIFCNVFLLVGEGIFAMPCASRWLFYSWETYGYGSAGVVMDKLKSSIRLTVRLQLICFILAIACMAVYAVSADVMQYIQAQLIVSIIPQGVTILLGMLVNARLSKLTISDGLFQVLNNVFEVHEEQTALFDSEAERNSLATTANPALRSDISMKRFLRRMSDVAATIKGVSSRDLLDNIQALADTQRVQANDYPASVAALPLSPSYVPVMVRNTFVYTKQAIIPSGAARGDGTGKLVTASASASAGARGGDSASPKSFEELAQGPYVAKLLYWRLSVIFCLNVLFIVTLSLGAHLLDGREEFYQAVVTELFPKELSRFGHKFATGLYYADAVLVGGLVLPFLCVIVGLFRWRHFERTRQMVRYGWILFYLFPFLIMLAYPYRSLVPYDEASKELCKVTFKELQADGTLTQLQTAAASVKVESELIADPNGFCDRHGANWVNALEQEFSSISNKLNVVIGQNGQPSLDSLLSDCYTTQPLQVVGATNTTSTVGIPLVGECKKRPGLPGQQQQQQQETTYEKLCGSCVGQSPLVARYFFADPLCTGEPLFATEDTFICSFEAQKLALRQEAQVCTSEPRAASAAECTARSEQSRANGGRGCNYVKVPPSGQYSCELAFDCTELSGNRKACQQLGCRWNDPTKTCAPSASQDFNQDELQQLKDKMDQCQAVPDGNQQACAATEGCAYRFTSCVVNVPCASFDQQDDCVLFFCEWKPSPNGAPPCRNPPAGQGGFDFEMESQKSFNEMTQQQQQQFNKGVADSMGTASKNTNTRQLNDRRRSLLTTVVAVRPGGRQLAMKKSTLRVTVQMPKVSGLRELESRLRSNQMQWTGNLWVELEKVGLNKAMGCPGMSSLRVKTETLMVTEYSSLVESFNQSAIFDAMVESQAQVPGGGSGGASGQGGNNNNGGAGNNGGGNNGGGNDGGGNNGGGGGGGGDYSATKCLCGRASQNQNELVVARCPRNNGQIEEIKGSPADCQKCDVTEAPYCHGLPEQLSQKAKIACQDRCPKNEGGNNQGGNNQGGNNQGGNNQGGKGRWLRQRRWLQQQELQQQRWLQRQEERRPQEWSQLQLASPHWPTGMGMPARSLSSMSDQQLAALVNTLNLVALKVAQSKALILNFEYVLGTIMGLYATKLLLPAAIGLISGLITGFNNLKHVLPQSAMLGTMSVICASVVLPLLAAFLATIFQIIGDSYFLAPCCICTCLGMGVPILFYRGLMNHKATSANIQQTLSYAFYVQSAFYLLAAGLFFGFAAHHEDLRQFLSKKYIDKLFSPASIAYIGFRLFTSMTLSKVATSDTAVTLAIHEFKDMTQMSDDSRKKFVAVLTSLRQLRGEKSAPVATKKAAGGEVEMTQENPVSQGQRSLNRSLSTTEPSGVV